MNVCVLCMYVFVSMQLYIVDPNDSELEKKIQEFRSLLSQYVSSIKLGKRVSEKLSER